LRLADFVFGSEAMRLIDFDPGQAANTTGGLTQDQLRSLP
jgi:hypothetical protein